LKNDAIAVAFINYNNSLDSEDPYDFFHYTVSIKVWHDNKMVKKLKGHKGHISCLLELPNGLLVSSSHDGSVKFWDVGQNVKQNDSCLGTIICKCPVTSMVYDGGDLFVGMSDGDVQVYTIV
jgi:WD40 repeat protein